MRRTSPTDRRAFTLVELMVVVLIIGVACSIAFVRLDNVLPAQRLRSAAVTIIGVADLARGEARLRQATVTLCYDLDKQVITITAAPRPQPPAEVSPAGEAGREAPAPAAEAAAVSQEPETLFSETLPQGVSMKAIYYGDGRAEYSGAFGADFRREGAVGEHMIDIREASGGTMSVYVPALSGSAFVVQNGMTYGQIHASRRLK